MKIIKLNAIDSTNSFLKKMVLENVVQNFTVVMAHEQTSGRGQIHTKWVSEPYKNLTFSVFCVLDNLPVSNQKYLNYAVSISVFEVLNKLKIPKLTIKWPNDILAGNDKICGILLENSVKKNSILQSVIGIGLNVNQEKFPSEVKKATSIKNKIGEAINLDVLLHKLLLQLKCHIELLNDKKYTELEEKYLSVLYKKNVPSMFKNSQNELFLGKIIGVSKTGKLQIVLENETIQEFGLKEVSFANSTEK